MCELRSLYHLFVTGLVVLALQGCGGGDSAGQEFSSSSVALPSSHTTVATVDSSVPQSAAAKVSLITGSVGSDATGAIPLPSTDSLVPAVVLALDADNRVILAALASGDKTSLNADSTARALVRVVGGSRAKLDNIEQTVGFGSLVRAIADALGRGTAPMSSTDVPVGAM